MHKIIIMHPGVQHAYQLANALGKCETGYRVHLYTNFILSHRHVLSRFAIFSKRVKKVQKAVKVYNLIFPEILQFGLIWLFRRLGVKNNNPYYIGSLFFNLITLPLVFWKRKELTLILYDTAGWPLCFFAKKWGVRVIMDFPSISHEVAAQLGINESKLGIKIKKKERQHIDYAFFCSNFAERTYHSLTSSKKNFVLPVGAESFTITSCDAFPINRNLKIAFIANMEYRKGLDILLSAYSMIEQNKELLLIGKISKDWVEEYCCKNKIAVQGISFVGRMSQSEMRKRLAGEKVDLHILPSRFDSFGMVVPETMMLGIPNILSPNVGAGELLEKDVDGFIMDNFSQEALICEIYKYLNMSLEEKNMLRRKATLKAREMSWDSYYRKVTKAFEEILAF